MAVNYGKVATGGVVAGVVMTASEFVLNEFVIAEEMAAAFASMNVAEPTGSVIAVFIAVVFVIAFMTMWLYAIMRPVCGAGPKTAAYAGLFMWFPYYAAPAIAFCAMGMVPTSTTVVSVVWGAVGMALAGVAGAWLYSD